MSNKEYKLKLMKRGETNPFLPNFSQFEEEANSHLSTKPHLLEDIRAVQTFYTKAPRFSSSIMINEDLAKQKYSDLPMQSIQEAQPQKKRRNKRHEYKKSRHFKSCNDQASKPISPSIFFVVSKSKKLSKKKQL